jgi:hypothetical protein
MAFRWYGLAAILSALPLAAGTIGVSTHASALLNTGDALSFTVPSWNFSIDAANFGLPEYPTSVAFEFVSDSANLQAQVDVVLASGDGSVSVSFGAQLSFAPGMFQGSRYIGAVSVLQGSLYLSPALSQQLFGNSPAVLNLLNTGPALTVGLPPYTLQQDLNVSLGGGGLSVGAPLGGVALVESPDPPEPSDAPEPGSGLLLLGGGALLFALSWLRRS